MSSIMSPFQQFFNDLDPSILAILKISNTDRCSVYCKAEDEKIHRTYHKPANGQAQRDPRCNEDLLFQCASLFKVFIAASLTIIIDKLSSGPNATTGYRKLEGAWSKSFTEVFNDCVEVGGRKMDGLPGDPSVRQLLLHYNGVYDINHILLAPDGTPLQCDEDAVDIIAQYAKDTYEQLAGKPFIRYSNGNYVLLALLVDKASGSLNKFLKEHIFDHFKMTHTFLRLEDLHSHSIESKIQPHVVSSNGSRRIFMPDKTLGLSDVVEIAWLGPYTSTADLGRFFGGLLSVKDGERIGLFDKAVFKSLFSSQSWINGREGYSACGLRTSLNLTGPGSHSLNRLISPDSKVKAHVLGTPSSREEIDAFYLAGSATGWASTVYFLPYKRTFVIVLTNTSGPLDASDLISKLCLQEIFDLQPGKAGNWNVSNFLPGRSTMTFAERRAHYVALARQIFDENAVKLKELEQLDNRPDTPISDCPDLPGKYFCSRNGQYLHVIPWEGENNERVLRIFIQSGTKSSQKLKFAKKGKKGEKGEKGEKYRICSPGTFSVLAIDCFGAWENLEFEVDRNDAGVKALSRQGVYLNDVFNRV